MRGYRYAILAAGLGLLLFSTSLAAVDTITGVESPTSSSTTATNSTTTTTSTTEPPTTTSTTEAVTTTTRRATPTTVSAPASSAAGSTTASWYGDESGSHTANGDAYDPSGFTFAHRRFKYGTRVRFCGRLGCVVATCTDRGPAEWTGRDFDLSQGSFAQVAELDDGIARVTWEVV